MANQAPITPTDQCEPKDIATHCCGHRSDHGAGLRPLVNDLPVRAFLTRGTMLGLKTAEFELHGAEMIPIHAGVPFTVGNAEPLGEIDAVEA
ncbi:MAG: hypothetical protein HC872_08790, partial [Gammaproteobacteria bacterium]|nr:hypothetical protein [Gammaproteobacteria bacterium]